MLLSTASTLSTAQKQGPRTRQKTHTVPGRLAQSTQNTEAAGGGLWPAAGRRGGVNSWRHTQIRGQKGKAGSAAHALSSRAFFWPLAQFQSAAQASPTKVPCPELG